jgi:hypothetical protein
MYGADTDTRTTHGVALTSGFQMLTLTDPCTGSCSSGVATDYPVGIPTLPNNQSITLGNATLASADDDQTVHAMGAATVDLTFGTDRAVDDCVVTLYQFDAGGLTTIRHFLLAQPPATTPYPIDASLFDTLHSYTIGVTCRTGLPGARTGDYTMVSSPMAESTFYSAAFAFMP